MTAVLVTITLALAGLLAVKLTLNEVAHWRPANRPQGFYALVGSLNRLLNTASDKFQPPDAEAATPMPEDLTRLVNQWPDQWAREGQERYARELFKVHRDWSKVHQALLQEERGSK